LVTLRFLANERSQNTEFRSQKNSSHKGRSFALVVKNFFVLLNNSNEALNQQLRIIRTKSSSLTQAFS
jgi:hypothetical protein